LDEEARESRREARGVRLDAGCLARLEVRAVAVVVAADQEVAGDRAPAVLIELRGDIVAGRAFSWRDSPA